MRLETRVSTVEELRVSVVTALIIGSIIVHIMRGVNPHRGEFSGDNFIPKTPINSSVFYCRGVEEKALERLLKVDRMKKNTDKE